MGEESRELGAGRRAGGGRGRCPRTKGAYNPCGKLM